MAKEKRPRILVAKPGLDGHDRGAKVVALGLRDEGFEVIYTGIRQTPDMIVRVAVQEDVDVVGLSCLSGAHKTLFPKVVEKLRESGREDVLVLGGGIIPDGDLPFLMEKGVRAVFPPGTMISQIADYIREHLPAGAPSGPGEGS